MDVKAAYLQARGLNRKAFVRPCKEKGDANVLWKLLLPAHGLIDPGCLWYMSLHKALTHCFGFSHSSLDLSMYMHKRKSESLILVEQVDDYLYAKSPDLRQSSNTFCRINFVSIPPKQGFSAIWVAT